MQQGLDLSDENTKLRYQVASLFSEKDTLVRERDQLVVVASRVAEEHRVRMAEIQASIAAAEKAAQDEFVAKFVTAFEDRLGELKADHSIVLKDTRRVHGREMCARVHPPVEGLVVPQSDREWEKWQAVGVPDHQPFVDVSDGEEENLEADFPEYTEPSLD